MDFADVLRRRQMMRSYKDLPVADDVLQRVLQGLRRAPSAGFSQGHRLVIVTDQKLRQQAADIAEGRYVDLGFPRWIASAPVHIYLCTREQSYHERYGQAEEVRDGYTEIPWPVPFWWFDCGALFVLLQLAALNEGLATGYFSSVYTDELDALAEVAGLRDDLALAGVITIGHPDLDRVLPVPANAATRLPNDELIEWRV
ncbi:nitroreductase family protein [Nonomuraea sp. K274]|uniref:Nitroreductase family protein n=1 Tax=Nonomuraea cypriaca TaxID=1187855 RepID=A0A931AFT8_9ACTN|nr:nitroreductase family protein [Nonomuraea cypriaca]MBF8191921.1 nitroreductase family protein [Nonomuraea cypriaca]